MSDNSSEDTGENEQQGTEKTNDEDTTHENEDHNDKIDFDDLPREERVKVVFENTGEAFRHLKEEWEEERMQVYFLFYSFAMVGLMMFILYLNRTKILIGAFAFYVITVLPLLYIYEEETYFQSDKYPTSDDQ